MAALWCSPSCGVPTANIGMGVPPLPGSSLDPQALKRQSWQLPESTGQLTGSGRKIIRQASHSGMFLGFRCHLGAGLRLPPRRPVRTSSVLTWAHQSGSHHHAPLPVFPGVADAELGLVGGLQEPLRKGQACAPPAAHRDPGSESPPCAGAHRCSWCLPWPGVGAASPHSPGRLPSALASCVWHRLEFRAQRGHFVFLDRSLGSCCQHSCGA